MYKSIIRPFLFLFAPETAHKLTFGTLKLISAVPGGLWLLKTIYDQQDDRLKKELFGIKFKNRIGLAAGLDKNAELIDAFGAMGFGFVEIGTVTPKGQAGNPQPRLFRLPQDQSLINRMGFNNDGLEDIKKRLQKVKSNIIIGGNIGKNKVTPNEDAYQDYLICFKELYPLVDYFVVNVSSPNTPGLRALQEKEPLKQLLQGLCDENNKMEVAKPILLKIAPDLTDEQLDDIVEIVGETEVSGIIATNTTIDRSNLTTSSKIVDQIGAGGLSGRALRKRSTQVIRYIHQKSNGSIPIIGVGGISNPEDAIEKLEAGAQLIQLYSGFIYEGPALIQAINRQLLRP